MSLTATPWFVAYKEDTNEERINGRTLEQMAKVAKKANGCFSVLGDGKGCGSCLFRYAPCTQLAEAIISNPDSFVLIDGKIHEVVD